VQSATRSSSNTGTPATPAQRLKRAVLCSPGRKESFDDEQVQGHRRVKGADQAGSERPRSCQAQLALQQIPISNVNYVRDTAGKQTRRFESTGSDKQQELERLKARLAELQAAQALRSQPPKP